MISSDDMLLGAGGEEKGGAMEAAGVEDSLDFGLSKV